MTIRLPHAQHVLLAAAALAAALRYHARAPLDRYVGATWFDQSKYLGAARAWAAGDLDPAHHWYLPGYPLLGALFARLTPEQPFWLPDLLCLLASLFLCAAIAAHLVPDWRWARLAGAAAFLATTVFWPRTLQVWVIPWTTTPTVPLIYAAILMALRFRGAPGPATAALAAASATVLASFRPTEAIIVCAIILPFMALWLLEARLARRRACAIAAAALLGAAIPLLALAAAHIAVHGLAPGAYITQSAAIGFEWRLIPLRWVLLFLGPQPYIATHLPGGASGGVGMIAAFPWIPLGIAGAAACTLAGGAGRRDGHALLAILIAGQIIAYLAYRDLHPDGLLRFENYHYFKPVLPLLGFYAILLAYRLGCPHPWPALAAGLAVLPPLLCWRAELRPADDASARTTGPHEIELAHGLAPLHDALLIPALGEWNQIYTGRHHLVGKDAPEATPIAIANADLKAYPIPGGLLMVPLRPLPAIPSTLHLDPATPIDPTIPPSFMHQAIRPGLPCIAVSLIPACTVPQHLPGPALALGTILPFGADDDPYLTQGWSLPEPGGRWTDGPRATLYLRPAKLPRSAQALTLTLDARPHLPTPLTITLSAQAAPIATWRLDTAADQTLEARVPTNLLDPTGTLTLQLTTDRRRQGLFVHSLRLDAE